MPYDRRLDDSDSAARVLVPNYDVEYKRWLELNRHGFVINVNGRRVVLHRATCIHIDRHNNPGAFTERASQKVCAGTKHELRTWLRENGHNPIPEKCGSCAP